MLLSIQWLRDYLQKSDVKIDSGQLSSNLSMRGLEVSNVRKPASALDKVVVGRIERIEKHPNADRLQVTHVLVSQEPDAKPLQIVCGAKNIAEGDIVAVALVGAVLPGELTIKLSAIRGVESSGMICSSKELGISEDGEGILQLPKQSEIGGAVSNLLGIKQGDTILELEVTANRGDCLGYMGLAREIAPLLKTKVREPKPARFRVTPHRTSSIIKVEVEDPALCPRYVARVLDSLKVGPSPDWIRERLEIVGYKSINNIVDITNFVMFEYGAPLHAFDLRKIESGTLRVAPASTSSDFILLDGQTVRIEPGDILILDGERPVALAGIMGGLHSQVEPDTTSILLEAACFDAARIRATAKRLGLSTEASKRFERGSDINAVALASERAAALLRDTTNANVYHPALDTNEMGARETAIALDMREVRKVTGLWDFTAERACELLDSIDIASHKKSVNVLMVKLPSHRRDLKTSIDLVEEVARLEGYDSIPLNRPQSTATYRRLNENFFNFESHVKAALSSLGFHETIHYSFTSEDQLRRCGKLTEKTVALKNPLNEEMKVMRTSLLPSLLNTYAYNHNRKITDQRIFEVSRSYEQDSRLETGVKESLLASALISGLDFPNDWKWKSKAVDFFTLKGFLEALLREVTTASVEFAPFQEDTSTRLFHPRRSAHVLVHGQRIGDIGEVHPYFKDKVLGTQESVVLFEIAVDPLKRMARGLPKFESLSKFPGVEFDLAFVVTKDTPQASVHALLDDGKRTTVKKVRLFDVYEGENLPPGKKSLAYRIYLQSPDRTLSEQEIEKTRNELISSLKEKVGAELRA